MKGVLRGGCLSGSSFGVEGGEEDGGVLRGVFCGRSILGWVEVCEEALS